jgi:hypothetical protein
MPPQFGPDVMIVCRADVLEPEVRHVVRLGSGNVVGEVIHRVVPGKAEPLADVGTRRQAFRTAAGHLARAFGGGKGGADGKAAGGNAGQSQEVSSGNRGLGDHGVRPLGSWQAADRDQPGQKRSLGERSPYQ